jgi:hypothetical protein
MNKSMTVDCNPLESEPFHSYKLVNSVEAKGEQAMYFNRVKNERLFVRISIIWNENL